MPPFIVRKHINTKTSSKVISIYSATVLPLGVARWQKMEHKVIQQKK